MEIVIQSLGWTLLHSLWQTLIIYISLRIITSFIPSRNANLRYSVSFLSLATAVTAFLYTFYNQIIELKSIVNSSAVNSTLAKSQVNQDLLYKAIIWYNANTSIIVTIYIMAVILLIIRLVYNVIVVQRLKISGITELNSNWKNILEKASAKIGVNNIKAVFSEKVNIPMMMGALKPVILIPITLSGYLSTKEAEAIMLHELAHIKRHDYFINIIQIIIETLLFFNPFIWLISDIIRKEREHCCDDLVVKCNNEQFQYARALSKIELIRNTPPELALGATGSNDQLLNRIKRIMEMKQNKINYTQLSITALCLLILVSSLFIIVPSVKGQSKDDKKKNQTTKIQDNNKDDSTTKKVIVKKITTKDSNVIIETDNANNKSKVKTVVYTTSSDSDSPEDIDVNVEEIVTQALANINFDSVSYMIKESLSEVDWEDVQDKIKKALNETSRASKETGRASKEIAEAQKELNRARKELQSAQRAYAQAIKSTRMTDIPRVPTPPSPSEHNKVIKAMKENGLIDNDENFHIEKKDNKLYIDGKVQSDKVYKKYKEMLPQKEVNIKRKKNSLSITIEG